MLIQVLHIKVMHFRLIILDYQDRPTYVIYTYRFNMLNSLNCIKCDPKWPLNH